ncbi:unnamed protein product [Paramecium octaurelia]|uniref:Uncharacterized protein n=1 Tax=Paramecium octaurelia TaxID=43137 RepID=A0A8S1WF41_PAROT|nr:unnamed protein product [Paramecium octaurelia]
MQIQWNDQLIQFIYSRCSELFENEQYLGKISQYFAFKYFELLLSFNISELRLDFVTNQIDIQIKTIGGATYIQTSNFICINSTFEEISTAKISVFDIVTSSDGIIMMQNLSIFQMRNSLQENIENEGCLSVNALNSLLNLQIKNTKFSNIPNRMSSSIITINPSLLENKLIFQNITIVDCVSLKNQIVKMQFITQANKQNSISFIDLKIYQNQESWFNLLQNIRELSESEIQEITGKDNAIIYLENCDANIENLFLKAEVYGNNLVENPSYLTLSINSKAMPAVESTINNIQTSILKLTPYLVMEQGIKKQTEMLMILSTQIIDTYQIFIVSQATYLTYIKIRGSYSLIFIIQSVKLQITQDSQQKF